MKQPTDPTAVRDFVMACADAWIEDERDHDYATWTEYEQRMTAARSRLQLALEWAMAWARVETVRVCCAEPDDRGWCHMNGRPCTNCQENLRAEADAAEKWSKLV